MSPWLTTIAAKKKKEKEKDDLEKKTAALALADAKRLEVHSRIAIEGLRGTNAAATLTLTPEMLRGGGGGGATAAESGGDGIRSDDVSDDVSGDVSDDVSDAASLSEKGCGARVVFLEVDVERNCPRCHGWGEKEGHWTMAIDKLCLKCNGFGRVEVKTKVQVPVRDGVTDGERVTVYGAGNGGFSKQLNALGVMGEPGESGDLEVTVAVLKEGETQRR